MKIPALHLPTCVIALVLTSYAGSANAVMRMNIMPSAACKAAAGPGAQIFYFDSQYTQNTSSSVQYLTCGVPEINPNSERSAKRIEFIIRNPTPNSLTFSCVLQAGYSVHGVNNAVVTLEVAPYALDVFEFGEFTATEIPARTTRWAPYTISCAIPPQGRIDWISVVFPETL